MPKVTDVTVQSGTTFNNPYESYSNYRPSVTLRAAIEEGEDPIEAARMLQVQADGLLADHKADILRGLRREEDVRNAGHEINERRRRIHNGYTPDKQRAEIDEIARGFPELAGLAEEAKKAEPQGERAMQRAAAGDDYPDEF